MEEETRQLLERLANAIEKQAEATQQAVSAIAMIADMMSQDEEEEIPEHL